MQHHLPETVRQQYLKALGVTQWYGRIVAPNASPIAWDDYLVADDGIASAVQMPDLTGSDSVTDPLAPEAQRSAAAQAHHDVAAKPAGQPREFDERAIEPLPQAATPVKEAPQTTAPAAATRSQGIEFSQRWWASAGWLIVDTRPADLSREQQQASDRLLANLAHALCGTRKPEQTHLIDWPLFVNRSIKHDLEEAQFYVRQKWRALQQQTPTQRLLLLGDRSSDLLAQGLAESATPGQHDTTPGLGSDKPSVHTWQQGNLQCLAGPGTNELLHRPGEKRHLWRALQAWDTAKS